VPLLLSLAAVWGASFMFIEVGLDDLAPTTLMTARVAIAAGCLVVVLAVIRGVRGALLELRSAGVGAYALGIVNSALPFTLIAWGQEHIDSGTAAISNASTPIWVAFLAIWFSSSERATGVRLLGIVLGLAGVAVLTGAQPEASWWTLAGTVAVVAASFSYAAASLIAQLRLPAIAPLTISTTTMIGATVVLLPLGLFQLPDSFPGAKASGAVLALAVGGTAIGLLVYFRIILRYGSARAAIVTYLLPVTALLYGALLLDETITVASIVGLVLILAGVTLAGREAEVEAEQAVPHPPDPA